MKLWQFGLGVFLASLLLISVSAQPVTAPEAGVLPQAVPTAQPVQGSFGNIDASIAPGFKLTNSLKAGEPVPFAVGQAYNATQIGKASFVTGGVQSVRSPDCNLQLPWKLVQLPSTIM